MSNNTFAGGQRTARCFRCAEVGSVNVDRQWTNTYIPSFQIPAAVVTEARRYVADVYKNLIDATGALGIYTAVLADMNKLFVQASAMGLGYQGPAIKSTLGTLADATKFKKVDANGKADGGYYAATQAAKIAAMVKIASNGQVSALDRIISGNGGFITTEEVRSCPALSSPVRIRRSRALTCVRACVCSPCARMRWYCFSALRFLCLSFCTRS